MKIEDLANTLLDLAECENISTDFDIKFVSFAEDGLCKYIMLSQLEEITLVPNGSRRSRAKRSQTGDE